MNTYIVIAIAYIFIGFIAYSLALRHQIELDMLKFNSNKTNVINGFIGDDYCWFVLCGFAWPFMLIVFIFFWIHRHILVPIVLRSIKDNAE